MEVAAIGRPMVNILTLMWGSHWVLDQPMPNILTLMWSCAPGVGAARAKGVSASKKTTEKGSRKAPF